MHRLDDARYSQLKDGDFAGLSCRKTTGWWGAGHERERGRLLWLALVRAAGRGNVAGFRKTVYLKAECDWARPVPAPFFSL